jgi:hypothetical protein
MESTIQYVKDRTESFDDYFPCRSERRRCKLEHILNWFKMFILICITEVLSIPMLNEHSQKIIITYILVSSTLKA